MTEREKLMRKIQQSAFAAHECALYLDNHPDNKKALARHNAASKALSEYTAEYEAAYGTLTEYSIPGGNGWSWVSGAWPWQNTEE